ncbi:MAG TPA: SRPBCC domain-containing protein [Bryobacteraceae bacterium]|nr:SRPBCC domain-containing protein [Bryobacteraceae bacterium]
MENEKETRDPIRQSVHVDCPVEEAFRLFTESFADWWPGDDSEHRAVEGGSVKVWDPPSRIEFTWAHEDSQTVSVEFEVEADGTRVTLTHRHWQLSGIATCFAGYVSRQLAAV